MTSAVAADGMLCDVFMRAPALSGDDECDGFAAAFEFNFEVIVLFFIKFGCKDNG
jgi:hypothetical protein